MMIDWQKGDTIIHPHYGRGVVVEAREIKGECHYSTRNIVSVQYKSEEKPIEANQEQMMRWGHRNPLLGE